MKHRLLFLLFIFYFLTRLYNLTLLPIFTDEAIYIYWAKVIATSHAQFFISLTDGKPPLLIWTMAIFLKLFPFGSYLFVGRFVSVLAGAIGLLGIYKLSLFLFGAKKSALLAGLLYVLTPFTLFYDRMALFDSLLSAMLIWSFYFALKTAKTLAIKDALLWGFFLGLAFLSKPPAVLFLPVTILGFFLFVSGKTLLGKWKKILPLPLIVVIVSEGMNNLLRISSAYPAMEAKNMQFQTPLYEFLAHPFTFFWGNLGGFYNWVLAYYTVPLFIAGIVGFLFLGRKQIKIALFLFVAFMFPILVFSFLGREIFPRYALFTTPYFLIALAQSITLYVRRTLMQVLLLAIMLFSAIVFDTLLWTNPPRAPLPVIDKDQYITAHPSGYGLAPIFAFLDKEAAAHPVTLVTQGTFGLYPYAFMLEYWDNKNITIMPRWPLDKIEGDIVAAQKTSRVYLVLKEHSDIPPTLPLVLVVKGEKPGGRFPILLTTLR